MTDIIFGRNVKRFWFWPFCFPSKGLQHLRTVNHCWKAKNMRIGSLYRENFALRAPSRNYLLETAPDWSIRQCYFPRTHSYVNDLDLHYVFEENNQSTSRIDIIFSKGKVPVETTEKNTNRPRTAQVHPVTSCCCRSRRALVVVLQRRADFYLRTLLHS